MMKRIGNVHLFGDHIDTGVILPQRYLHTADPRKLAMHCMEEIAPSFAGRVKEGDMVIAGRNFGCGAPREQAVLALKATGISCVIARSFSRVFSEYAEKAGLPLLVCDTLFSCVRAGDTLEVDLSTGRIRSLLGAAVYQAELGSNISCCEIQD